MSFKEKNDRLSTPLSNDANISTMRLGSSSSSSSSCFTSFTRNQQTPLYAAKQRFASKFVNEFDFATSHLISMNYFYTDGIAEIFRDCREIEVFKKSTGEWHVFRLHLPRISRPTFLNQETGHHELLLPHTARMRNMSYSGKLTVSISECRYKPSAAHHYHMTPLAGTSPVVTSKQYQNNEILQQTTKQSQPNQSEQQQQQQADHLVPERKTLDGQGQDRQTRLDLQEEEEKVLYLFPEEIRDVLKNSKQRYGTLIHGEYHENICLAECPVMLRTALCNLNGIHAGHCPGANDQAGFFVINGTNRVISPPSRWCWNHDFVFQRSKRKFAAEAEVRSCHDTRTHRSTATLKLYITNPNPKNPMNGRQILVSIPFLSKKLHIAVIFLALGWDITGIRAAIRTAAGKQWFPEFDNMVSALLLSCKIRTEKEALLAIAQASRKSTKPTMNGTATGTTPSSKKSSSGSLSSSSANTTGLAIPSPSVSTSPSLSLPPTNSATNDNKSRSEILNSSISTPTPVFANDSIPKEEEKKSAVVQTQGMRLGSLLLASSQKDHNKPTTVQLLLPQSINQNKDRPQVNCSQQTCQFSEQQQQQQQVKSDNDDEETEEDWQNNDQIRYARDTLNRELIPHVGLTAESNLEKGLYLGSIVWKLFMCTTDKMQPDDRDDYGFKRFDSAGVLMANLLRQVLGVYLRQRKQAIAKIFEKEEKSALQQALQQAHHPDRKIIQTTTSNNPATISTHGDISNGASHHSTSTIKKKTAVWSLQSIFTDSQITARFAASMGTGKWTAGKGSYVRMGVSRQPSHVNRVAATCEISRLSSTLKPDGKHVMARLISPSQYGFVCPTETPEGRSCGLVMSTTIGARLSTGSSPRLFIAWMEDKLANGGEFGFIPTKQWAHKLLQHYHSATKLQTPAHCNASSISLDCNASSISSDCNASSISSKNTNITHSASLATSAKPTTRGQFEIFDEYAKLRVEGIPLGWILHANAFVQWLREQRRLRNWDGDMSVYHDPFSNEILVRLDPGRLVRPLYLYDKLSYLQNLTNEEWCRLSISKLVNEGCIEYADALEIRAFTIGFDEQDVKERQLLYRNRYAQESSSLSRSSDTQVFNQDQPNPEQTNQVNQSNKPQEKKSEPGQRLESFQPPSSKSEELVWQVDKLKANVPELVFTHMEIDGSFQLGLSASLIPNPQANQSPRNTYQCAMGKQAMSNDAESSLHRSRHQLFYCQHPLVATKTGKAENYAFQASGFNAAFLMLSKPLNQEDSLYLRRQVVERGALMSGSRRLYKDNQRKFGSSNNREKFEVPDLKTCGGVKDVDYSHCDPKTGIPPVGTPILSTDVVIAKTTPVRQLTSQKEMKQTKEARETLQKLLGLGPHVLPPVPTVPQITRRCASTTHKGEPGIVTHSIRTTNAAGLEIRKVEVTSRRQPEIGDKFSSRHGQKGTCSRLVPDEEMVYTADGMMPDVVVNPNCLVSRMTVAQQYECLLGKAAAVSGADFSDATAFMEPQLKEAEFLLKFHELTHTGKEVFYHPVTGEKLEGHLFFGSVWMQRLKHMTSDKMHARGPHGPNETTVRQPLEGRGREGGQRFGGMENDCVSSHGSSHMLLERMLKFSDPWDAHLCGECGFMACVHAKTKKPWCTHCGTGRFVRVVLTSFAFMLLVKELAAMGIRVKFELAALGEFFSPQQVVAKQLALEEKNHPLSS